MLERLHAAEGLGAVEALVGEVVDELVELLDRRLRVVALIALLQLLEKVFHVVEIVGRHLDRLDGVRVGDRDMRAHLEQADHDQYAEKPARRQQRARHRDGHGLPRVRTARSLDAVLDRGLHERRALGLGARGERHGARQSVVQTVEPIERLGPGLRREPPRPRRRRDGEDPCEVEPQHRPRRALARDAQLAQCNVDDGHGQADAQRPCACVERAAQPDPPLGCLRQPADPLDAVLGGRHPYLGL